MTIEEIAEIAGEDGIDIGDEGQQLPEIDPHRAVEHDYGA